MTGNSNSFEASNRLNQITRELDERGLVLTLDCRLEQVSVSVNTRPCGGASLLPTTRPKADGFAVGYGWKAVVDLDTAEIDTSAMLTVHTAPAVEPEPQGGWQLTYWLGDAFDFTTPFRAAREEISSLLGEDPRLSLAMPPHDENEDFVEGTLQFAPHKIGTYYEYSLGYLSLSHQMREPLDSIAKKVRVAVKMR